MCLLCSAALYCKLRSCLPKSAINDGSLSAQVHSMIEKLAQSTDIRTALVVGGLSMQVQASTLKTSPEIVVATPVSNPNHLHPSQ